MSDPRPVLDVEGPRDHLAGMTFDSRIVIDPQVDGMHSAARLRVAADQLDDLDRGPSAQGLRLPREERSDAQVTLTAAQLRLAADLLEHPAFGA